MGRIVSDTNLETRTARQRLKAQRKPFWRVLEQGLHLGYRRTVLGNGSWVARRFIGNGKYAEARLQAADDMEEADGATVCSFSQAQLKVREWARSQMRIDHGLPAKAGPYTVAKACEDYMKAFVAKGGKSAYPTQRTIDVHILPELGTVDAAKITAKRIRDWQRGLAAAPLRLRTGKRAEIPNLAQVDASDGEAMRARRATANRILTVLKAALNVAFQERLVANDEAWRAVKPFKSVDAPVIRYLSGDECRRLVNACAVDMRRMVQAALLTGCRYGELTRLRCEDVNLDAGSIAIREAKGGKPRHAVLTEEAKSFFQQCVAGRPGRDAVFLRADGKVWKAAHQVRPMAEACQRASIAPAIGFHVLRHTHASTLAMKGVPMGVIAVQLGHADTRITEKHYAHLAPNYVASVIRDAFPLLGIVEAERKIVRLAANS